jgi:predicted nucleic acid-binding protein
LILLDTNLLLRYARIADPDFATVDTAVNALHASGEVLSVVPQNIYESWAVATHPTTANGLGFSVQECQIQVARIKRLFRLLPDLPTLFSEWEAIVLAHACHGRVSFDARLVASMRTHGVIRLLTFNGADFARFPGLSILDPATVANPTTPPASAAPWSQDPPHTLESGNLKEAARVQTRWSWRKSTHRSRGV